MGKYAPLYNYLIEHDVDLVRLTFQEIEGILGDTLPQSAFDYKPWWYSSLMRAFARESRKTWQESRLRIQQVDVGRRVVLFARPTERGGFVGSFEQAVLTAFEKRGIHLFRFEKLKHGKSEVNCDFISRKHKIVLELAKIVDSKRFNENAQIILEQILTISRIALPDYRKIIVIEKGLDRKTLEKLIFELESLLENDVRGKFELWEIDAEKETGRQIWPEKTNEPVKKPSKQPQAAKVLSARQLEKDRKTFGADRIVSFDDNRPAADKAIFELEDLVSTISPTRTNEHTEEKEAVINDLHISIEILKKSFVHARVSFEFIQKTLVATENFILRISALVTSLAVTAAGVVRAYDAIKMAFGL